MKNRLVLLLFFAAALTAGFARAEPMGRDFVVILLDGSGSMSKTMGGAVKMDAAKRAIAEVLKTVPASTQVGLLVFNDNPRYEGWIYPLGPRDDEKLLAALQPIRASGGTPLGQYIKRGADRLLEERQKQLGYGTYRLLVVTDGEATDGNLTDLYAPAILARGISLDVIGVDMKSDHALATRSSSYRRANDPAALRKAIAEVLAEVGAGDRDMAPEAGFELLAGLPDAMVPGILDALDNPENAPIGTGGAAIGAPQAVPPAASAPAPAPSAQPGPASRSGLSSVGNVVAVAVVVVILLAMSRARSRR
jgi:hypothetical protein